MRDSLPEPVRFFRLARQYRRSAVYVFVGAILAGGAAWAVHPIVQQQKGVNGPQGGPYFIGVVFVTLATGLCLVAFRWRLRVDCRGVARRRLWRWDLWPWEAFQDGRIRKGASFYRFTWPDKRPWCDRTLSLELLDDSDRDALRELCGRLCVAPPAPEAPDAITLRFGLSGWARFTPEGIFVDKQGFKPDYPWSDVTALRIVRLEHDRHDFHRVEIELPDRTIKLFRHKGNPTWRGAEAAAIAALLRLRVPAERTLIAASHGRPGSLKEADYRLAEIEKRRRQLQRGKRLILAFTAAIGVAGVLVALGCSMPAGGCTAISTGPRPRGRPISNGGDRS